MENKRNFPTWIKQPIEQYGFVENQDYVVFHKKGGNSGRGRLRIEYRLTIDTAKEIFMFENNENGRQARWCFIEVERKYFRGKSSKDNN